MKFATNLQKEQHGQSATLRQTEALLSSSSSVTTKIGSTPHLTHSRLPAAASNKSRMASHQQLLSKSLEKTFLRMRKSAIARDAYLQAEVITALTQQIRAIRLQRGWTQRELAQRLGTTQAAVSRLEDPSYGRLSLGTLLDLARVFDAGLQVKFVSFVTMLSQTFKPSYSNRLVHTFEEEAPNVGFYSMTKGPQLRFEDITSKLPSQAALKIEAIKTQPQTGIWINVAQHSSFTNQVVFK